MGERDGLLSASLRRIIILRGFDGGRETIRVPSGEAKQGGERGESETGRKREKEAKESKAKLSATNDGSLTRFSKEGGGVRNGG